MKTKTCIFAILLAAGLTSSQAQDTWTQKANFGGTARDMVQSDFPSAAKDISVPATTIVNTVIKDFWEYDPATNAWTQKADFGGTAKRSCSWIFYRQQRVYRNGLRCRLRSLKGLLGI